MRTRMIPCALWGLGLLCAPAALAQEPPAAEVKATVTIGDTAAPPEWHLSVPVALSLAPDAEVGKLTLRLVYPAKALKYTKVRATETLKRAGFDVAGTASTEKGDGASVALEFKRVEKSATRLPSGTLAIVELKVDAKAPQKSWPMTAEDVRAWGVPPDGPEVKAASKGPAKFLVTPPGLPILSCFFYMH